MRPPGVQVLEFLKAEDDSSALDALTLLVDSRHDDILNGIHPHSRVELHKALFLKVNQAVQGLHASEADLGEGAAADTGCLTPLGAETQQERENKREMAENWLAVLSVILRAVVHDHAQHATNELAEAIELLNNEIMTLDGNLDLQDSICSTCEAYFFANGLRRDAAVTLALPYLVMRAMDMGKASDMKRCHALGKEALSIYDYEDETSDDLKKLLLRASFHPAFLKAADGRKFISLLFLQPSLVKELTAVVKNQVLTYRKPVLEAFGDVLWRAWEASEGATRLHVEDVVLRTLVDGCLYSSSLKLTLAVRDVLSVLHANKKKKGVEQLMFRLYDPCVLASMRALNSAVRLNAIKLLEEVYPIHNPESTPEDAALLLSQQHEALEGCLEDACPAVRAAAAEAVSSILDRYWDAVPSAFTTVALKKIAQQLVFDSASPVVRIAGLDALRNLVDSARTHALLNRLLPGTAGALRDANPKVRQHFCVLLTAVSRVRGIKVSDVVSSQDLLEALSFEASGMQGADPGTAALLHRLMVPALMGSESADTNAAAVAQMLRECPEGGVAFCKYLCAEGPEVGGGLVGGKGIKKFLVATYSASCEAALFMAVCLRDHLLRSCPTAARALVPNAAGAHDDENADTGAPKPAKNSKKKGSGNGGKRKRAAGADDALVPEVQIESVAHWGQLLAGWVEAVLALSRHMDSVLEEGPHVGKTVRDALTDLLGNRTLPALFNLAPTAAHRINLLRLLPLASGILPAAHLRVAGQDASLLETCTDRLAADDLDSLDELRALSACLARVPSIQTALVDALLKAVDGGAPQAAPVSAGSGRAHTRGSGPAVWSPPTFSLERAVLVLSVLLSEGESRAVVVTYGKRKELLEALTKRVQGEPSALLVDVCLRMAAFAEDDNASMRSAVASIADAAKSLSKALLAAPPRAPEARPPLAPLHNAPAMRNLAAIAEGKKRKKDGAEKEAAPAVVSETERKTTALAACLSALCDRMTLGTLQRSTLDAATVQSVLDACTSSLTFLRLGESDKVDATSSLSDLCTRLTSKLVSVVHEGRQERTRECLPGCVSLLEDVFTTLSALAPTACNANTLATLIPQGLELSMSIEYIDAVTKFRWLAPIGRAASAFAADDGDEHEGGKAGLWAVVSATATAGSLTLPLIRYSRALLDGGAAQPMEGANGCLVAAEMLLKGRRFDTGSKNEVLELVQAMKGDGRVGSEISETLARIETAVGGGA